MPPPFDSARAPLDNYWMPFTANRQFKQAPRLLTQADGMFFRDDKGREGLGGMMAIGKSKARVYVETDIKVTFGNVAGVDEAVAELREIVEFLKDPQRYGRLGARAPKGRSNSPARSTRASSARDRKPACRCPRAISRRSTATSCATCARR